MRTAIHHAMSSAKKWGGNADDYMSIHDWFDQSKEHGWDFTHRAILHHTLGITICEQVFGPMWTVKSTGKKIPTRWIGEQHLMEDFGFVPTPADWMKTIKPGAWMLRGAKSAKELGLAQALHDYTPKVN